MKTDLGLLVLRASVGSMMLFAHGWGKLVNFGVISGRFPDPIGLGSTLSLTMAIFAEVFCAAAVVLGLATRFTVVPLIITMAVAAFVVHADDPWHKQEFALLYLIPFVVLMITGGGKFSVDAVWKKVKRN